MLISGIKDIVYPDAGAVPADLVFPTSKNPTACSNMVRLCGTPLCMCDALMRLLV